MSLIKSISGIRGTMGGRVGEALTPVDTVKFVAAYATFIKKTTHNNSPKIVLGRDARISGDMMHRLVSATLMGMGFDVVDIGLATTPTTEIAVPKEKASGGIILTASHNPKQWNALKLLDANGEFLSGEAGAEILKIAEAEDFTFAVVDDLGSVTEKDYLDAHIQEVLDLELVDVEAIKKANFKVAIDCVNSVGGLVIPQLLKALGVKEVLEVHCEPHGNFSHNPEPLPENLTDLIDAIKEKKADVGFAVDPDVDRLAIISEDGTAFGEEYTLVAVADYVLTHTLGNTVSNLSSTRALRDVTEKHGATYTAAAVGEVNVVAKMKETNAVIGGEGNGGVIYPASHYGRDALVGIALFLTQLAKSDKKVSELRATYPSYFMSKQKIDLTPEINIDELLLAIKEKYKEEDMIDIDGVKIEFKDRWVHLRKSNTEPIIRIYTEAPSIEEATALGKQIIGEIKNIIG
ncbi:MAG TPA: phosphoglucosamine mutase [Dysgonamonadaceae bacterium]|nr:phosphoglucosamine mutase [Dysgonamonadaceae bacterium]